MNKTKRVNRWDEYHNHLAGTPAQAAARDKIMKDCGWSQSKFFRLLKTPAVLSIAEKKAVAAVYNMPVHFLFPELEAQTA